MGIINHGILGGFSGKVGPIVGFRWKSNYYIRSRAAKVSNPRTPKQQAQRGKFSTVFSFLKTIKPFIRLGYKEFSQEKSAFNSAMSYMLKKAVNSNGTEITIDINQPCCPSLHQNVGVRDAQSNQEHCKHFHQSSQCKESSTCENRLPWPHFVE